MASFKAAREALYIAIFACFALSIGCSRSKPSNETGRPVATLAEVNHALHDWYMMKAAYPTNLNELESAPFFNKRLPLPPPGQKLILDHGRAEFVPN